MKTFSSFDPNRELQRALANLETFAQSIENESYANLSQFEVKEGKLVAISGKALSTIMSLAYRIVLPLKYKAQAEQKVLEEVLESSNVVRSYFPLFQILEDGDIEQQKFVDHVKGAIARFNKVIDKVLEPPPTLAGRMVHFFYEHSRQMMGSRLKKINFPQKASLKIDFPPLPTAGDETYRINPKKNCEATASASHKITILHDTIRPSSPLSKQTLELYAMKVITLLGQYAFLPHAEASIIVEKTAKEVFLDKQAQLLTISQKLVPMPGQHLDVAVSFRADPLTSKFTIPTAYQVSDRAVQSGFPHPLQHNGWALADFLLPVSLPNIEEFPHLDRLYKTKQTNASQLLPRAELAEKARKAIRLKRAVFKENKKLYLDLLQQLTLAIVKAAPPARLSASFEKVSAAFFATAAVSPYPYDFVADAHQLVLECAICRPQKGLQRFWLEHALQSEFLINFDKLKDIFFAEYQQGLEELLTQKQKSDSPHEKCLLTYCLELSSIFFEPAAHIAMQHYSEVFRVAPPSFDLFTQKLQAALYIQLFEFQKELNSSFDQESMKLRLKSLLENDITLFESEDLLALDWEAMKAVQELNTYYQRLASKQGHKEPS